MSDYRRGTNQYRVKHKKDVGAYMIGFLYLMVFMLALYDINLFLTPQVDASENIDGSAPVTQDVLPVESMRVVETKVSTPAATLKPSPIVDEIKEVFGKHAEKAFKVLSCENSSLNPKAINTAGNYPEGSKDVGIFQVNSYWQGVNEKFLLDPEINIRIAYKIFKDNGESFERWTCGRKFGI